MSDHPEAPALRKFDPEIDDDNPEWTEADFARAKSGWMMPEIARLAFPNTRGRQVAPVKRQVTLRLSPEVIEGFRATGKGWQTRMDAALKAHLGLLPPA